MIFVPACRGYFGITYVIRPYFQNQNLWPKPDYTASMSYCESFFDCLPENEISSISILG